MLQWTKMLLRNRDFVGPDKNEPAQLTAECANVQGEKHAIFLLDHRAK